MEIKSILNKPYTDTQRCDFIVENNHKKGYDIIETETALEAWGLTAEEAEQEAEEQREAEFKNKFFEIPNFGWFRKQPKGYSSAVESLNTAFNAVTIMQKLPAGMLIFYQEPDFTKPEECTEEWLIEHQTYSEEMTAQEFGAFYVGFMTAWNNQEHVTEE